MEEFSATSFLVMVGILAAVGGVMYWLIGLTTKGHLMRCPDTGSIAFVDVSLSGKGEGDVVVRNCDMWPEKKDCAQGCLARYGETGAGIRVNLHSLRPFEPQ